MESRVISFLSEENEYCRCEIIDDFTDAVGKYVENIYNMPTFDCEHLSRRPVKRVNQPSINGIVTTFVFAVFTSSTVASTRISAFEFCNKNTRFLKPNFKMKKISSEENLPKILPKKIQIVR